MTAKITKNNTNEGMHGTHMGKSGSSMKIGWKKVTWFNNQQIFELMI